ncbi:MAG TPA: hypothetical protein PLA50_19120 [Bacteroidia bacterium]|nr:hypothetical protein [Bacteroidia bacterium]
MRRLLFITLLAPACCLADNLVKDGSMDSPAGWSGDRKFETVDDNRVMLLEAKKNRIMEVSTEVSTRNVKDLVVTFRYRSSDYVGRGFQLRGTRPGGGFTYNTFDLKVDGEWHERTWRFSEIRDSKSINFSFSLLEGTGTVMIDDVVIKEKSSD